MPPDPKLPEPLNGGRPTAGRLPTPRHWQAEALKRWLSRRRGVVSVVTGGGKTLFALQCFAAFRADISSARLAVIVPTIALLDQWTVALQVDLGVSPADIGTYSGEGRPGHPGVVNVLVMNTARGLMPSITADGPWMLVVDECHRSGSPENAKVLEGNFAAVLGLSATPQRQFDDGFERFVEPRLGGVIYEYDHAAARRDGVIAAFEVHNIHFQLTNVEEKEYAKLSQRLAIRLQAVGGAMDDPIVASLIRLRTSVSLHARWRVPTAIAALRRMSGKAIVFHERIAAAEAINESLSKSDRRPTIYHSRVYGPTRRERLRLFRAGVYDTLVTCRALDEGLNVPDASLAMIVASTTSRRQRIQRLGRVLRATGPDKQAVVASLYATPSEEKQLREEQARLQDVAVVRWFEAGAKDG